ncbi:hypothetical protein ABZP36_017055 [Zizania latifolia]
MFAPAQFPRADLVLPQRAAQEFDLFVVIDFEATCEKGKRIYPQEIVEFPAVLVDAATGRIESSFRTYVRPRHHPRLTDFCQELTGISQDDVDGGVGLAEALVKHDEWLRAAWAMNGGGRFAVVTWGDWDCGTMLESECRFKGITKPPYFDRWINLRVPFEAAFGGGGRSTLQEAVRAAGQQWTGRLHCGLDDAYNTALLLVEIMRRGATLSITGSLAAAPPGSAPQKHKEEPPRQLIPCGGAVCCYCGVLGRGGVLTVPGPTQGRRFYCCGNWTAAAGAACPFFVWATLGCRA